MMHLQGGTVRTSRPEVFSLRPAEQLSEVRAATGPGAHGPIPIDIRSCPDGSFQWKLLSTLNRNRVPRKAAALLELLGSQNCPLLLDVGTEVINCVLLVSQTSWSVSTAGWLKAVAILGLTPNGFVSCKKMSTDGQPLRLCMNRVSIFSVVEHH